VRPLAARYQTVAVDLAGHGESGIGRQAWTMAAFGDDVVAVAEQLGLGELVLIGHSMGGDVIVEAALRLGERVAGLVWVDTYSSLGEPPTDDELEAFLAPFREDFAGATRALVRRLFTADADAGLVEWVAADMSAEALRRHGVKTVLVSGVGHFLMMEDPDRFNRLLGQLIETFRG
jgi:pimeloyl-ACP methyl ester carboxylesterase